MAAEGIESRVLSQRDHYSFNVDVGELNRVRVLVPAYEYNTASALLAEHTDSHGEVTFACPACGEAYDTGSLTCNSCGAELPVRA